MVPRNSTGFGPLIGKQPHFPRYHEYRLLWLSHNNSGSLSRHFTTYSCSAPGTWMFQDTSANTARNVLIRVVTWQLVLLGTTVVKYTRNQLPYLVYW